MRNIRLVLEYEGTDFSGWQTQANGRSVQEEVTKVLAQVLQESVNLIGAGRTDAGVHAVGQAANFRTTSTMALPALRHALDGLLPSDVAVRAMDEVHSGFHARFDATSRSYSYHISTVPSALQRRFTWHVRHRLDTSAFDRIAPLIAGEHDFAAFCKSGSDVNHHRCTVMDSVWEGSHETLVYRITANRFLYGMVRALVGTMVDMARGHIPLSAFGDILASGDRSRAGGAAPPHGLILESVRYGEMPASPQHND